MIIKSVIKNCNSKHICSIFQAPAFVFPPLEVYARSAPQTLGFTRRTCGYIGHAIQVWVMALIVDAKENPIMTKLFAKIGKQTYENALNKKQKSQ